MKWLFLTSLLLTSCSQLPKQFESERRGIRHTASHALYPHAVGNYSFLNHDDHQALAAFDQDGGRSTAIYLDYKSGGPMTSLLYRPYAKIETFQRPKNTSFESFVAVEVKKLTRDKNILGDLSGKNKAGAKFRQVKFKADQPFLSEGFSGVGFHEKLPAFTKIVYVDKGEHVLFMTTSYPANDAETHARPNSEFVARFVEAQK
jgi:hypothetical protein